MENIKYIVFYALLICVALLGFLSYHWIVILPSAFILSIVYIIIKGNTWRQIMGKAEMNGVVVFVATMISQIVLSAILYGLGRLLASLFN
ncbi:MAG: hypothetical protein KGV50_03865 [Gammaproteobacteria bacterium]|nr:hypothetical protein [Gammaproteobacteria bacterium]